MAGIKAIEMMKTYLRKKGSDTGEKVGLIVPSQPHKPRFSAAEGQVVRPIYLERFQDER